MMSASLSTRLRRSCRPAACGAILQPAVYLICRPVWRAVWRFAERPAATCAYATRMTGQSRLGSPYEDVRPSGHAAPARRACGRRASASRLRDAAVRRRRPACDGRDAARRGRARWPARVAGDRLQYAAPVQARRAAARDRDRRAAAYFDTNTSNHNHFFIEAEGELRGHPRRQRSASTALPEPPEDMRITHIDVVVRLVRK